MSLEGRPPGLIFLNMNVLRAQGTFDGARACMHPVISDEKLIATLTQLNKLKPWREALETFWYGLQHDVYARMQQPLR